MVRSEVQPLKESPSKTVTDRGIQIDSRRSHFSNAKDSIRSSLESGSNVMVRSEVQRVNELDPKVVAHAGSEIDSSAVQREKEPDSIRKEPGLMEDLAGGIPSDDRIQKDSSV
jgi:3-dehydroquinate synthase class II